MHVDVEEDGSVLGRLADALVDDLGSEDLVVGAEARAPVMARRPPTLYERAPLRFWQGLAALLALALLLVLLLR
jgi:hypothetical protein